MDDNGHHKLLVACRCTCRLKGTLESSTEYQMAEVQTTTTSGEMTLRFIEFVRMHSQNASLFLGRIPHPQTGKPTVNLDVARMLIDHLAVIAHKTRGNLTPDEETVLNSTLSSLQMAFVEASKGGNTGAAGANQATAGEPNPQQPASQGAES